MKNLKTNVKRRCSLLAIALILTAMLLQGCSKKAEAQESKGSSVAGSTKTGAYNSESDFQIDWDKNVKDGVIIAKYIGTKNEVNIPPSIQNNPVTGIGYNAFYKNNTITRVTIPNSVTYIGDYAFQKCTNLTSVTFQGKVNQFARSPFIGDLENKYFASDGGPGTYKRFANGEVWKKQ